MISIDVQTQGEITSAIAQRMRARRKERGLTQAQLAERSGVSLGSLKRFEQTGEVSLSSLVNIAVALGCQRDFDGLFAQRGYRSIEEAIADARAEFR